MVALDSMIECVNGRKRANEIKPHDLVYCYDANGVVSIGIVKDVYIYARQPQLKVNWKSQGKGELGDVVVTPGTNIRLREGEPKAAQDLEEGTSVLHIHRGVDKFHGRVRIYSSTVGDNPKDQLEEQIIKLRWFKSPSDYQLHHTGFKPNENDIHWDEAAQVYVTNLESLSNAEHQKRHTNDNLSAAEKNQVKLVEAILGSRDPESSINHWIQSLEAQIETGPMIDFVVEDVDPVEGRPTQSNYIANEICVLSEARG